MKAPRCVCVDIDGTLSDDPGHMWGNPRKDTIARIQELVAEGHEVIVWSGNGKRYATNFCRKRGIKGVVCSSKPKAIVDDYIAAGTGMVLLPWRFRYKTLLLNPAEFGAGADVGR